jgi:hypothetical protein
MKRAELVAADVERPVAIDEPRAAPLRQLSAETEILPKAFLLE